MGKLIYFMKKYTKDKSNWNEYNQEGWIEVKKRKEEEGKL